MPIDVGGLGLSNLSTQITLDKFAMLHWGLLSGPYTIRSVFSLLDRSVRISKLESDTDFEATISLQKVPHLPLSLLESEHEAGLSLRRGGLPVTDNPSCPLDLPFLSKFVRNTLMHFCIIYQADLIIFFPMSNGWDTELFTHIPRLFPLLPIRFLQTGQFWSSERLLKPSGYFIEIMGFMPDRLVNGRTKANCYMVHTTSLCWWHRG